MVLILMMIKIFITKFDTDEDSTHKQCVLYLDIKIRQQLNICIL